MKKLLAVELIYRVHRRHHRHSPVQCVQNGQGVWDLDELYLISVHCETIKTETNPFRNHHTGGGLGCMCVYVAVLHVTINKMCLDSKWFFPFHKIMFLFVRMSSKSR